MNLFGHFSLSLSLSLLMAAACDEKKLVEILRGVNNEIQKWYPLVVYRSYQKKVRTDQLSLQQAIDYGLMLLSVVRFKAPRRDFIGPLYPRDQSLRDLRQRGGLEKVQASLSEIEHVLTYRGTYVTQSYWEALVRSPRIPVEELLRAGLEMKASLNGDSPLPPQFFFLQELNCKMQTEKALKRQKQQ